MRENVLIEERNEKIYQQYSKLWGEGIRENIIIAQLKNEYFLAETTIYRILLKKSNADKEAI